MTIKEMRERLGIISNEMTELGKVENLNTEEVTKVNELSKEAGDLKNQIEAKEAIEATIAASVAPEGRKTAPVNPQAKVIVSAPRIMENGTGGFDNIGDYFMAVKDHGRGNGFDERLKAAQQQEKVGTDGGFLVPADLISGIQKKVEGDESLLSRCRQFNTKGNRIEMMVNENAPWDQSGETIKVNWVGEGKTIESSKTSMKEFELKLHKLAAIVDVTEEMLDDSALIESYITSEVPDVMVAAINNAIVSGNGVKKPLGILNSGFGFEVAKEAAQTAATINFQNIKKMYTHLIPKAKRNAITLYNVAAEEQLIGMKIDPADAASPSVYLPNNSIDGAPYGTLWGRPVMPMGGAMQALGSAFDIAMVDFSYYYAALKVGGLKSQMSVHAKWDEDISSFKFTFRIGGGCPFANPMETEFGAYKLSGFTYLQERA